MVQKTDVLKFHIGVSHIGVRTGLTLTPCALVPQLQRPIPNGTVSIYCLELTYFELAAFTDVAKSCFGNGDFDPFDPVALAALPATATCPGKHTFSKA